MVAAAVAAACDAGVVTTAAQTPARPIVLVPGWWLGAWAWDEVAAPLRAAGRDVVALTPPGQEPERADRGAVTLADQAEAVVGAVRAHPGAVLVGHSGAGWVVQLAADAVPDLVSRLVWVDSGPAGPGPRDGPDATVDEMPLPSWDELVEGGEDLSGIDDAHLASFRARAVPQPAATAREEVLTTGAWARVPATVVCCTIPSTGIREMVVAGERWVAALAEVEDLTYADLPTGHWPMWSRPADLAALLLDL